MTKHVALYCRLSPRPDGSYEGVDAQEKWGRDYAAQHWPNVPIEVFSDKGISAANGDDRPEFERFREWVAEGKIARVWAVEQSRLERREVEWFRLAAELDAAGIDEVHTNRDGIVGVLEEVAGIKAVLNAAEVRKLKRRVNDRLDEIAAEGRPAGSVLFGYKHVMDDDGRKTIALVPEQAEAIKWAAEQVLSGWSLANVAAELRARGLRGPHGGKLTPSSVRKMITNPTVAGKRVHRGEIVGKGIWEPILDESTWQACRAKLSAPRVVQRSDGGEYVISSKHTGNTTGRRYLLTGGVAVCDVCDAPLVGSMKQLRNAKGVRTKPYLLCHPNRGGKGCVGIMLDEVERHVASKLFDHLESDEFAAALSTDDHARRRDEITDALADIEGQRRELARMWSAKELTSPEWAIARGGLDEREHQLRADLATVPPPVKRIEPTAVRASWPGMTLDEQREQVAMWIERVTIKRAVRTGRPGFDHNRVVIQFADGRR